MAKTLQEGGPFLNVEFNDRKINNNGVLAIIKKMGKRKMLKVVRKSMETL